MTQSGEPAAQGNRGAGLVPPLLLALLLVAAAYAGALRVGYIADDRDYLVESPFVKQLLPPLYYLLPIGDPVASPAGPYYRPFTNLSHALERRVLGSDPFGPHLVNVVLHLLSTALVYALARRGEAGPWTAAICAALFGLFPRLTEAVTWISGRATLLSTAFVLGALWLHRSEPERVLRRIAAALAIAAGLLCKESTAVVVGAIVVLELFQRQRTGTSWGRMLRNLAPSLTVTVVYILLRPGFAQPGFDPGLRMRATVALQALGYDAWMLVNPFSPQMFVGVRGVMEPVYLAAGVVFVAAAAFLAFRLVRRAAPPLEIAVFAMAGASTAITLPFFPVGDICITADRFLYPVVASLAVGLALALRGIPPAWTTRAAAAGMTLAILFALTTIRRNEVWQSELGLATETVAQTSPKLAPYTFLPHFWLARIHLCAERWDEAIAEQELAVRALTSFRYVQPAFPERATHAELFWKMKRRELLRSPTCDYR